jgi:hypothetical protein
MCETAIAFDAIVRGLRTMAFPLSRWARPGYSGETAPTAQSPGFGRYTNEQFGRASAQTTASPP